METFWEFTKLSKIKVDFALEAYALVKKDCLVKVVERFSGLDLAFLGAVREAEAEEGSASAEAEGVQEFGAIAVDIPPSVENIAERTLAPAASTITLAPASSIVPPAPAGASLTEGALEPSTAQVEVRKT